MIATSKQHPVRRGRAVNAPNPPAWLKLEPGETLLASYRGKQLGEVVINVILAVLGLTSLVVLVALLMGKSGHKDFAGILTSLGGTVSGLVVTLAQLRMSQLHVTSKMLIFAEGKKAAGVPLASVAALKTGDGSRWTIGIYAKNQVKPVGKITVLDTARVARELAEYCRRGGASLAADTTVRGIKQ